MKKAACGGERPGACLATGVTIMLWMSKKMCFLVRENTTVQARRNLCAYHHIFGEEISCPFLFLASDGGEVGEYFLEATFVVAEERVTFTFTTTNYYHLPRYIYFL
ncbi:unnamed protein product [Heterosigma akashiwo]